VLEAIFNWNTFWILLMIIYVPICFSLIGIVLLQKGKGVGFAGAFGLGAGSEAMFGPRGSVSLPVRLTQVLGGTFFVLALVLSLTGGLSRRGLAPDAVEATTVNGAGIEGVGMQQLEGMGLGSAVGGPGASPAPGVIDESGEGEPELEAEPLDLDADLPDIVLEETPIELTPEDPAADDEAAEEVSGEIEADEAEADSAADEQPADGS